MPVVRSTRARACAGTRGRSASTETMRGKPFVETRNKKICEPRNDNEAIKTRVIKVPTLTMIRRSSLVRALSEPRAKTSKITSSKSIFRRYLARRYHKSRVNAAKVAHRSNVGMDRESGVSLVGKNIGPSLRYGTER